MIYIDRESTDESGRPIRPNDIWFKRAAVATEKAIEEQDEHEVEEALYKRPEVRAALEELFHDKCA